MRASIVVAVLVACSPNAREMPGDDDTPGADASPPGDGSVSSACAAAAAERSYIGCTYWPVDLLNAIEVVGPPAANNDCSAFGPQAVMIPSIDVCDAGNGTFAGRCDPGGTCPSGTCMLRDACGLDAQHSPYAIIVANVGVVPSEVTLADATGHSTTVTVGAGETATFKPQLLGFADHSIALPGITAAAYKLTATEPVVAYQMNPLDDVGVFSNDASLLLPEQTFGTSYIALSYPNYVRRPTANDWPGYLTLVAAEDTTVEVTASTTVLAGAFTLAKGETKTFAMRAFETLQLTAATGDISGTRVTSDRPLGAYSGHEAAVIADPFPFRGPCCADHLEEQLYPTSTWGSSYAIARGRVRATQIHDYIRIIAQRPNTVVQVLPDPGPYGTCGGKLLAVGEVCDVYLEGDIELRANEPILVGHYMVSGGGLGPQSGDPAMAFVPPIDQFRDKYTIVVPEQYEANDLILVTPTGGSVILDGTDVTLLFAQFASNAFTASRIQVTPGAHTITCPMGCSVTVSGWNTAVSYLYSGGLDLRTIVL